MNAWGRRGASGAPIAPTGGAPAEAGALRVEVVDDVDDLAALAEPWQRLLLSSAGVTAFASPAWVLARFRHLERPGDVYAVTVWRGSRLVGLAPFARTRLGGRRAGFQLLVSAGSDQGDDGDPLLGPDPDAGAVARAIADHLAGLVQGGNVAVNLRRLRQVSPLLTALDERDDISREAMGQLTAAAVIRFDTVDDPAAYLDRAARKHDIPRRMRRLTERFPDVAYVADERDVPAALAAMRDMLARRWADGEGPRLFATERLSAFTHEAVTRLVGSGTGRVSVLSAGGRPVAISTVLQVGTVCVSDNPCFEPDLARYGLGQAELYLMLSHALSTGATEVDLRGGDFPYKRRWANAERLTRSMVVLPPGRRSHATLAAARYVAMSVRARRQQHP